jgi:predicted MFS family arabinose efflux permease
VSEQQAASAIVADPHRVLPDVAERFDVTAGTAGLTVVLPGLLAAISAPLVTILTARMDRRHVLLALTATIAVADGLSAWAPNFPVLLLGRALLGVAVGAFWTIGAGIGPRLVAARDVTRATSFITAGISAGTVISLPLGRAIADALGDTWVFGSAAGLAIIVLLLQGLALPAMPAGDQVRWGSLTGVLRTPRTRVGLVVSALVFIAHFGAYTYVTPYLAGPAHLPTSLISVLLLVFGAAGLIGNFTAGAALARSVVAPLALAAALLAAATLTLAWAAGSSILVVAMIAIWGAAWGAIPVCVQTYMMRADRTGGSLALFVSTSQIALALGSVLGGRLVDDSGLRLDFTVAALPALAAVVVTLTLLRAASSGPATVPADVPADAAPAGSTTGAVPGATPRPVQR